MPAPSGSATDSAELAAAVESETPDDLHRRIRAAFPPATEVPTLSLRGGNALDEYRSPPPYDAGLDLPDDAYIESNHWGIHFLDPASWLYYLPILLEFSLAHMEAGTSSALDTFLFSLRGPDSDPPRFAVLSEEQRGVVIAVLEALGFSPRSRYQEDALQALQECWYPEADPHEP